jgi:hypothetical protein
MNLPAASHSFHTAFAQCPSKAWHRYIARDVPVETSDAMTWGTKVHSALEEHLRTGALLPAAFGHYSDLYKFPLGYKRLVELKLGIRADGSACDFFADDVYARGVLDLVIFSSEHPDAAVMIDHKTGKVREDPGELRFHAVLLKAHRPSLRSIKGWYNWLNTCQMGNVYDLSDTEQYWVRIKLQHARILQLHALGEPAFAPRQGPLCPWCPVVACRFHP